MQEVINCAGQSGLCKLAAGNARCPATLEWAQQPTVMWGTARFTPRAPLAFLWQTFRRWFKRIIFD